mmetsp:Transcript_74590/g.230412  ORF Transcript_74590/g.230412 Transcript_74590/m.230412 type:complete len:112 (-) Transcript_74590:20-355(-)
MLLPGVDGPALCASVALSAACRFSPSAAPSGRSEAAEPPEAEEGEGGSTGSAGGDGPGVSAPGLPPLAERGGAPAPAGRRRRRCEEPLLFRGCCNAVTQRLSDPVHVCARW